MIIRVSELEEQGLRIDEAGALGSAFTDPSWRLDSVALEVEAEGVEVFVRGRLAATVPLTCGRCVEAFAGRVAADLDVDFYDNDELDLSRVVENETMLALPMKPLCRPDCRGLCAVCGANRNVVTCTCAPHPPDPRLAAFRDLAARHTN